jgi:hypothetical protein
MGGLKERRRERNKLTPIRFSSEQIQEYNSIFRFLNEKDRDILFLIFVAQKKQSAVQQIMRRSQPSLCYDIQRIKKRLQFICYLNSVFDVFLDFVENHSQDYDKESKDILTAMFYTTSLTQSSEVLDQPQIRIRYKFDKLLRKMESLQQWEILEIFQAIRNNLNIVRRMYKPELELC